MDSLLKYKCLNCNFQKLFKEKGYIYFSEGNYNLNIIGIRNLIKGNKQDNTFNDALVCLYKENGIWKREIWECTTDPGLKSLKNFSNIKGCAILAPNQYKSAYQIGYHKGQYEALVQKGSVQVYRDNNKDNILDFNSNTIEKGIFGINIHRSNPDTESTIVDGWSAGCTVFKKVLDFNDFMKLCYKSKDLYGNSFTYTLITTNDLDNFI